MSYNDFLTNELSALSDDRSTIEYDNGDRLRWLGAALNPFVDSSQYSRSGMQQNAKALREKNVNQALESERRNIKDMLQGTGVNLGNLTLSGNQTEEALTAELESLKRTGRFAQEYRAMDGASASDIVAGSTPSSIIELGQKLTRKNKEAAETDAEELYQKRLLDSRTREDSLTERMNIREDRRDARAELTRAQERKDSLELRRDNMNLEYARLSQADAYRAQDRKDKAILALLSGLGNLGAGFTI